MNVSVHFTSVYESLISDPVNLDFITTSFMRDGYADVTVAGVFYRVFREGVLCMM